MTDSLSKLRAYLDQDTIDPADFGEVSTLIAQAKAQNPDQTASILDSFQIQHPDFAEIHSHLFIRSSAQAVGRSVRGIESYLADETTDEVDVEGLHQEMMEFFQAGLNSADENERHVFLQYIKPVLVRNPDLINTLVQPLLVSRTYIHRLTGLETLFNLRIKENFQLLETVHHLLKDGNREIRRAAVCASESFVSDEAKRLTIQKLIPLLQDSTYEVGLQVRRTLRKLGYHEQTLEFATYYASLSFRYVLDESYENQVLQGFDELSDAVVKTQNDQPQKAELEGFPNAEVIEKLLKSRFSWNRLIALNKIHDQPYDPRWISPLLELIRQPQSWIPFVRNNIILESVKYLQHAKERLDEIIDTILPVLNSNKEIQSAAAVALNNLVLRMGCENLGYLMKKVESSQLPDDFKFMAIQIIYMALIKQHLESKDKQPLPTSATVRASLELLGIIKNTDQLKTEAEEEVAKEEVVPLIFQVLAYAEPEVLAQVDHQLLQKGISVAKKIIIQRDGNSHHFQFLVNAGSINFVISHAIRVLRSPRIQNNQSDSYLASSVFALGLNGEMVLPDLKRHYNQTDPSDFSKKAFLASLILHITQDIKSHQRRTGSSNPSGGSHSEISNSSANLADSKPNVSLDTAGLDDIVGSPLNSAQFLVGVAPHNRTDSEVATVSQSRRRLQSTRSRFQGSRNRSQVLREAAQNRLQALR